MQYPNNIQKKSQFRIDYGNRGMDLENLLNETNDYYKEADIALIFKKPTPIGVVDVHYASRGKVIDKAYFKSPSTLDYNGLYKGRYIEFEAKETRIKTSFPLSNIHEHQIKHIEGVLNHGGIVFLIIKINQQVFLLKGDDFLEYLKKEQRKSIAYSYIKEKGYLLQEKICPALDYLHVVDNIYFGGNV